jgi:putative phosphoribosyl transferase
MRFGDRAQAGQELASMLMPWRDRNALVFGLVPGGMEVAFIVAHALGAPLDVMVTARLVAPDTPGFGIGAVAPGDARVISHEAVHLARIPAETVEQAAQAEISHLEGLLRRYRGDAPMPSLTERSAILVDDGLATVLTARAGIMALRRLGASTVVYASPVCMRQAARSLCQEADTLVSV